MSTSDKPFEYTKQPSEKELIGVDFSRRVPTGETISSSSVVVEETIGPFNNAGDNAPLQISGVTVSGKKLICMISEGSNDWKYRLSFKITLSDDQIKEEDVTVIITES